MNNIKDFYKAFIAPIGTTDDITACDCCGKSGLKGTVVFRFDEDAFTEEGTARVYGFRFLGSHCALNIKKYASNTKRNKITKNKIDVDILKDAVITANDPVLGKVSLTFKSGDLCYNFLGIALEGDMIRRLWERLEWAGDIERFKKHFNRNYFTPLT